MIHEGQLCPRDSRKLVYLSDWCGENLDLFVGYCPKCDVAVVFVSPTQATTPPAVLQWCRREGQLELRNEDRQRWAEVPRQYRACCESSIRDHVEMFLSSRHMERLYCHRDGGSVPVLRRWRDGTGTSWMLTWCQSCQIGFLYASDPDYGWEDCATVAWHPARQEYELVGVYASAAGHAVDQRLVDGLPPLPALLQEAVYGASPGPAT
jgi:hypothetical protein